MERREFLNAIVVGVLAAEDSAGGRPAGPVDSGSAALPKAHWLKKGLIQAEGSHEPYTFVVRRGGQRLDAFREYTRLQSEEVIAELARQGVECFETHFYKGLGIEAEKEEMEETKRAAEIAHRHGLKVSAYIQWNTMMYETFFAEQPAATNWIQRDNLGQPILLTYGYQQSFRYRPCFSCQEYLEYLKRVVKLAVEWVKADFIDFDNFDLNPEPDSCHCVHCVGGFRAYLANKYSPEVRKERFGFETVSHINPPQWNVQNPPERMEIVYDPAIQEWIAYRCDVMVRALAQIATFAKSLNSEVAIEINPCGIDGTNRAWEAGIDHSRLLEWTDTVVTEESNKAAYYADGRLVSKIRSYKLARAYNNILVPTPEDSFDLAESLAFNQTLSWLNGYPLSPEFVAYIEFYRNYREFYIGAEDAATVAVFRSHPSITYHNARCQLSAVLTEQALIQARVPFSLLFDDQLSGVSKYRVLVLPDSQCLSDVQIQQIRTFVSNGGGLILIGESGFYDEWRRVRPQSAFQDLVRINRTVQPYQETVGVERPAGGASVRSEYGSGRVVYVPEMEFDGPLPPSERYLPIDNRYWKLPKNWRQLLDAVRWAARDEMPLEIDGPPYLIANIVSASSGKIQALHLLNYNYKSQSSIESIPVTWQLPNPRAQLSARLLRPGREPESLTLSVIGGSRIHFVVPSVERYAVVVVS